MHEVLHHLANPQSALVEFLRVLKPGGFVAVCDSYVPADIRWPNNDWVERAFQISASLVRHNGGNPEFGARQREQLHAAGFRNIQSGASFENFSANDGDMARYVDTHRRYLGEAASREKIIRLAWRLRLTLPRLTMRSLTGRNTLAASSCAAAARPWVSSQPRAEIPTDRPPCAEPHKQVRN
jgi:SAM-dependent methyltransferase